MVIGAGRCQPAWTRRLVAGHRPRRRQSHGETASAAGWLLWRSAHLRDLAERHGAGTAAARRLITAECAVPRMSMKVMVAMLLSAWLVPVVAVAQEWKTYSY